MVVCTLLMTFFITLYNLRQDSLWNDEAWTAWAVRSLYIHDTLERVRGDVHPPLYFLVLSGLGRLTGDSVLALRWPSALFGLIGLAATYAIGKRLFDPRTGLMALVILATHSFFVYYAREARMYSLLLALGALATLLYWRWRTRPSLWRSVVYGLSLAAVLYTHYAGALIAVTHIAHLVLISFHRGGRHAKWYWLPLPYVWAVILFAPWLPTFAQQLSANPNGPLAIPVATDWSAVAALALILTSGHWLLVAAPFVLGTAIPNMGRNAKAIVLLVLWLLITPVMLLLLNAWFTPVYQVRYTIAMLPAGALLVAYGLRHMGLTNRILDGRQEWRPYVRRIFSVLSMSTPVTVFFVLWLAYTQLTMYNEFWPSRPGWETTMRAVADARQPLEPIIIDFAPYSPAAYYNRQLGLGRSVALDLSWRLHSTVEVRERAAVFQNEPSVWVALPVNTAKTWHMVSLLDQTRHIGYRSSLVNMIFYRFDEGDSDDLGFRFGDLLRYAGGMEANQQFVVRAGEQLCAEIKLRTLLPLDNAYSYGLHIVDLSGNLDVAQWDAGLGVQAADESLTRAPCLDVPADTLPGHYHLELTVYNWSTVKRLPVLEDGGEVAQGWGDVLMLAAVDVTK